MLKLIESFPQDCKRALKEKIILPKNYRDIDKILIGGMGGSAIPGDIVRDCFGDELKIPLLVNRGYELPAFADEKTLHICISYSGDTKETLEQLKASIKKGCKLVGISSGGRLQEIFKKQKLPFIKVKAGVVPRAALPYLLFSVINILRYLRLIKLEKVEIKNNPREDAKDVAEAIAGTFPVIYSIYPSVARRFKTQLNENAKMPARWEALPEAAHNDIETFGSLSKKFSLILLRDQLAEREEIKRAIEFLKQLGKEAKVIEIFAKGETKLERILYLIWFTDFVSCFLAIKGGIEPEPTPNIERLKEFVYG